MPNDHVDVLISGAGPNGLMLACELALAGIRPVVLDQLPEPSSEPKANGLVGQVVRLLDIRGLYKDFSGSDEPPAPLYEWIFAGMRVPLAGVADNPMYALMLHAACGGGSARRIRSQRQRRRNDRLRPLRCR
jgi:2-polyprenyl-6-methoxyphenol hydroxylase-like FAD-dependent oxidoreductase